MLNRICCQWIILESCNYRCPYCFYDGSWDENTNAKNLPAEQWIQCWENFFQKHGRTNIFITGGEPFTYPGFIQMIKELSRKNTISIFTNLSWEVQSFFDQIYPAKVNLIANFHPQFTDSESFIEKALFLDKSDFISSLTVCSVAYPPNLGKIKEFSDRIKSKGIHFLLIPFWGIYNGVVYPEGYNEKEKEALKCMQQELLPIWFGQYKLECQLKKQITLGKMCSAGHVYFAIYPDASVIRCRSGGFMGNFSDKKFTLFKTPTPCQFDNCICLGEERLLLEALF